MSNESGHPISDIDATLTGARGDERAQRGERILAAEGVCDQLLQELGGGV